MTIPRMCFHISFLIFFAFANSAFSAEATSENEIRFNEAMQFYGKEEYLQSAKILRELIRADREKSLYWFNFGNCLFMMKKYDTSIKFFNKVIQLNTKLVTVSKIYKAKALVAVGKNTEAQLLLQDVLAEKIPASLAKMARADIEVIQKIFDREDQALEKYREGDADAAERILLAGSGEALATSSGEALSGDAQILLGMIYIKQNRRIEAEKIFFRLSRNRFLESDQQELVRDFLKRTRKNESLVRNYAITFDVAAGNTSNAYLDGASQALVSSQVLKLNADFSYRFFKDQPLSFYAAYNLNDEEPTAAPELKAMYHTLSTGGEFTAGDFQFSARVFLQQQNFNNQSVLQKTGFTVGAEFQGSEYQYGLAADISSKSPTDESYNYLKGEEIVFRPYYGFWTESLYVQFALNAGVDNVSDIVYADGARLPLNQNYTGLSARALWEINKYNLLGGALAFTQRTFKNTSLPAAKKRTDTEMQLQLKYTYYFLPKFSVNATIEHITNNSTLGADDVRDKNYKADNISLGFTWDVFE